MASATTSTQNGVNGGTNGLSAAQKLMQKHDEAHQPTIQEVPDEEDLKHPPHPTSNSILEPTEEDTSVPGWVAPISAKAAGKQKADSAPVKENKAVPDTQSEEAFPGLGGAPKHAKTGSFAPIWGAKNGTSNGISTSGSSTPQSGANTPLAAAGPKSGPQSLAGQIQAPLVILQKQDVMPRTQLKKPLPEILKDINKKLRTNLTMKIGEGGSYEFRESSNQRDAVKQQAIKELGNQVCAKVSSRVSIPRSARAHIIGKQGSTIKSLQEATGARIQMPKLEDTPAPVDEDDDMIDITLEGTAIAIAMARKEISKIANERTATVNTKLRNIPAEFYPFLSGPVGNLEESHGVQIRVPPHYTWTSQPPPPKPSQGQAPAFIPAVGENHISLAGDRAAVLSAKAEIEKLAQQLRQQLSLDEFYLNREQHQFVIGERGVPAQDFFNTTGCAIIMPTAADEGTITIVGPPERLQNAVDHALDLGSSMNSFAVDISRQHRNAPDGARVHARNITQYLRDRKEIERIAKLHRAHIETPVDSDGASAWQLYYRSEDRQAATRAQNEIISIITAHPPSRMSSLPIDSFFHDHLRREVKPQVKKDYGVHLVVPNDEEASYPVLLVFENEGEPEPQYQVPRGQPTPAEIRAFQRGLEDARKHILEIVSKQAEITKESVEVPRLFHDKLRKFIKKEQENREANQIPVRVHNTGNTVHLRGPAPSVDALAGKIQKFVEQATEEEKERGFTLSFDFPQKHANQLIGKGGSNIRDLRDKFDVEINVNDGVVELKGPKAKAEAAKSHISSLGRQWADETTHTLKIEPKFHRELIGAQGQQINRLQTRYNVQIHFPRSAKPPKDDQSSIDAASEAGRRAPRREQEPDEVIVKGPKKGADEAREEILSLVLYYKEHGHSATVAVQAGQIASLIGQRGSGMEDIRQTTGARIDIPNARDYKDPSTRVEISIKGTKAQVAEAKKLLEQKRDVFDQTVVKHIEVDKKHHRALIGTGGSALRDIVVNAGGSDDRRELARTVQFPKAESDGNTIKVEGKADVVDKIIAAMQKIVEDRDNQKSEIIEVPTDKHRSLIGRGGETKKELESKFKVSIDIPRQGSGQTGIKIAGLPADVEQAKAHVQGLVKEQEGETIQVPKKVHHSVSENGLFFRKLRNDHQVTVDHAGVKPPPKPTVSSARLDGSSLPLITDDPSSASDAHRFQIVTLDNGIEGDIPWILRGPPENITKAKAQLQAAIEQALKNSTTGYLVLPDPSTYRYVIGQGGSKVNSIRKATGCKITVPRDQAKDEAIEIIGNEEGVEKAKDLILKAVKEGGSANGGPRAANGTSGNGNGSWD